jgi:tetratricopeptide (TPR) repeat protein
MKRIVLLTFIVSLLIVGAAAAQDGATPMPVTTATPDEILAQAEAAIAQAEATVSTVNTMLAFLQVASLVLGALLAVAALVGLRNAQAAKQDMREELNDAKAKFQDMLQDSRNKLNQASGSLKRYESQMKQIPERFSALDDELNTRLQSVQQREERAINALTLVQLGKLQVDNRNWEAALRTFDAARAADPTNRVANYYAGELYLLRRELDYGIDLLHEAQPDSVAFPAAEAALAYGLRLKGDMTMDVNERNGYYAEAERHYINALKGEPGARDIHNASIWTGLGALYRRQGRLDDAIRCYAQAALYTPDDSYPLVNLAMLELQKGEGDNAKRHFLRVVEIAERRLATHPNDQWARFDAITANLGSGNVQRASDYLDRLLAGTPERGPIESFLGGLRFMAQAKSAPSAAFDFIERVQARISEGAL